MYEEQIPKLMELFDGLRSAHGVFFPERFEGKKQLGKISTVRQSLSPELWLSHLEGKVGLGIIPINAQSECVWGVIDVDDYDLDFEKLLNDIKDTPLVCCRSKSGGAHLFIYVSEFVSTRIIRDYLRNMVGSLGLGNSEIFPKQEIIHAERGDVGNWLNMPYFGINRKCIQYNNYIDELSLDEFLIYAFKKRVNKSFFDNYNQIDYDKSPIDGGPPCLQLMSIKGFPEHTRNISLFNIGVYAKKAVPDKWKAVVRQFSIKFFGKGLSEREIEDIIKSLDKKEYSYQCHEEPLCSFCNSKLCRTRKYGISNIIGMPIINSVTKVSGDISVWFIDVEGGRLELTTEELYDNRKFVMRCFNDLNILPHKMKPDKWATYLQGLIDKSIEIRDENMFQRHEIPEYFKQFFLSRLSKNQGDLGANRCWFDKDNQEVRFKFEAFTNYLKFRKINVAKAIVLMYFKSRGSRNSVTKDKTRRSIWYMALRLTDEELMALDEKEKGNEVL